MVVATSMVTKQGQISIPAEVRKRLGLHPGHTQLVWDVDNLGQVVVKVKRATLESLHEIVGEPKVHLTLDDLQEARRECWDERAARVTGTKR